MFPRSLAPQGPKKYFLRKLVLLVGVVFIIVAWEMEEGELFIILGVSASSPWWTFTLLLPPLIPLTMRGRLWERLLPTPGQDDRDTLAVT
jgi:hypothetical protein